jgi:sterol 3beta-glucosyltransferase
MALCAQMGSEAAQEEQDTLPTLPPLAPRISRLHRASSTRLQERQDMLRSLPALGQRAISKQKRKNFSLDESTISSSQILIRPGKVEEVTEPAPPLGMAMEKIDLSPELPTIEAEQSSEDLESSDELNRKLLEELAAVFGLEQPEEISQVYACQIVRSSYASIIKGQLYVLQSVVCFYAYIPQRMKSGYLYKRGRQNPKYNKYWFILQGHTLSYYTDKAKPYFPRGNIDLSAATTVQMSSPVSQSGTCEFSITSGSETFSFRTESVEEMEIWVKQLGIAIYRAQHDSDTIKQLIPIYKISSIEQEAAMVGFTTVQINLQGQDVANDEVSPRK